MRRPTPVYNFRVSAALKLLGFLAVEYVLFIAVGPALFARPSSRAWVNDFVFPAAVTLLLTGGGALALLLLEPPLWGVIAGFVVMLGCSTYASLAGRFLRSSILYAGVSCLLTFSAVGALFLVGWR